ncbi:TIR domain-containing protein [Chitinophaga lutea]
MARNVFFSFHYENDVWRANIVRHSWVTKPNTAEAGFVDAAEFEEVKKGGEGAIKRWIDSQLIGTSVTVVLIGADTNNREYIKYELEQSWKRGNGIVGIYIHQLKNRDGQTSIKGSTGFGPIFTSPKDDKCYFYERFRVFDWVDDLGYSNFGEWVEEAARNAGR